MDPKLSSIKVVSIDELTYGLIKGTNKSPPTVLVRWIPDKRRPKRTEPVPTHWIDDITSRTTMNKIVENIDREGIPRPFRVRFANKTTDVYENKWNRRRVEFRPGFPVPVYRIPTRMRASTFLAKKFRLVWDPPVLVDIPETKRMIWVAKAETGDLRIVVRPRKTKSERTSIRVEPMKRKDFPDQKSALAAERMLVPVMDAYVKRPYSIAMGNVRMTVYENGTNRNRGMPKHDPKEESKHANIIRWRHRAFGNAAKKMKQKYLEQLAREERNETNAKKT